jgi:hypothetical protein
VWTMKSSMAVPIKAPTVTILRYQPANCILRISPSEEPEAAVTEDTCGGGFEGGDDGREGPRQSQILAVEVDAPDLLLIISNNAAAPTRFQVAVDEVSCSRWLPSAVVAMIAWSFQLHKFGRHTSSLSLSETSFFVDHRFYLKTLSIGVAQNGQI